MAAYRILSIDGGGARGVIPAVVLERLTQMPELNGWLDQADLVAGTSTGGLLALAIAHGVDVARLRALCQDQAGEIFDDSWIDDVADLGNIIGAEYDSGNLRRILKSLFGQTTLRSLRKKVLITSFDLDNEDPDEKKRHWKPKLFHNFPADSDGAEMAWQVGLYTCAAPTYFPSENGYIDGGVYAPNPSMCALAQAIDARQSAPAALQDVVLFSLGTGTNLVFEKKKALDWGVAQWAKPLISLMFDGVTSIADFQCEQLLGTRYHRLAPKFPPRKVIALDDIGKVGYMADFARNLDLGKTKRWLAANWL